MGFLPKYRNALLALLLLGLASSLLPRGWKPQGVTDFAAYWTAGQLLGHGSNPYSDAQVLALERDLEFPGPVPLVMRNPPWALPVVLPFGMLPYPAAQTLWFAISLAAIVASCQGLRRVYGGEKRAFWVGILLTGVFLPVATVLVLGQMGPLILLGIVGFLILERAQCDLWAGISLSLVALKPHLAFLLWPALLLWVWRQRRWRAAVGFFGTLGAFSLLALAFDRHVFTEYWFLLQGGVSHELTPTVGGGLRLLTGTGWLQWVPAALAVVWSIGRWVAKKENWAWREEMPLLLLVSLAFSPYAWFFDQVILLPAVWQVVGRPGRKTAALVAFTGINLLVLIFLLQHRTMFWYAWTGVAWLGLYVWTQSKQSVET